MHKIPAQGMDGQTGSQRLVRLEAGALSPRGGEPSEFMTKSHDETNTINEEKSTNDLDLAQANIIMDLAHAKDLAHAIIEDSCSILCIKC